MTAATLRTTTSPRRGRGKCLSLPGSRLASSTRIRRCPTRRQNGHPEKRIAGQKTASRIFFAAPLKTHPENATQTLGTHQENYGWSYDFASDCADAPNNTVLGYVAPTVGASRFLQQAEAKTLEAAGVGLTRILGFVALALTPISMGTGDELNRPMTLADFNRLPPINNKLAPPGFPGDELENHHWLPQEFRSWFEAAPRNFNIENFRE